jgi:SAM-dependent methyltransferase
VSAEPGVLDVSVLDRIHSSYVYPRRVRVLSEHLAELLPPGARVLDVGTGDGLVAASVLELRPDLSLEGIDVLVRPRLHIEVRPFDGMTIPHDDASFDAVMLVDVVHHAELPLELLTEATRVASRCLVVKDLTLEGLFAERTLQFMDDVGNARHGVALPHAYWSKERWLEAVELLGLRITAWRAALGLYPFPASLVFDRSLQFVARLERSDDGVDASAPLQKREPAGEGHDGEAHAEDDRQ